MARIIENIRRLMPEENIGQFSLLYSVKNEEVRWIMALLTTCDQLEMAKEALTVISKMESAPIDAVRFHEARFTAREALDKIKSME